jgi:hypothetical protein
MAEAKAVARAEPKLLNVSLTRPVSFVGTPSQSFSATKFVITRDERGDVTIRDARGHSLFVPKQLAILEYGE